MESAIVGASQVKRGKEKREAKNMKTQRWTITTLDKSPAMTRTPQEFNGTFEQAIQKAKEIWSERHGSAPCIHSVGNTTHWWFRIAASGEWTNRNYVPTTTGMVGEEVAAQERGAK